MADSNWRRLFYCGVCVFGAILLVVVGRWWWRSSASDEPPLYVAPQGLQLGHVLATPDYVHSFALTNCGARQTSIDRFLTSCGCAEVRPEHLRLAPGESNAVQLQLDLFRYLRLNDEAVIPATVKITPIVNGVTERGWMLEMNIVRPKLFVPTSEVDFGLVSAMSSEVESAATVQVGNSVKEPKVSTVFPLVTGIQLVRIEQKTSYSTYRLQASLSSAPRPFGEYEFAALVNLDDRGESEEIPCRIRFDSGLRVEVEEPPMRVLHVGQSATWSISVFRTSESLSQADIRLEPSLSPCTLQVRPEQVGVDEGSVWRFRCQLVPECEGNLRIGVVATGLTEDGVQLKHPLEMRFYVLAPDPDVKGQ